MAEVTSKDVGQVLSIMQLVSAAIQIMNLVRDASAAGEVNVPMTTLRLRLASFDDNIQGLADDIAAKGQQPS